MSCVVRILCPCCFGNRAASKPEEKRPLIINHWRSSLQYVSINFTDHHSVILQQLETALNNTELIRDLQSKQQVTQKLLHAILINICSCTNKQEQSTVVTDIVRFLQVVQEKDDTQTISSAYDTIAQTMGDIQLTGNILLQYCKLLNNKIDYTKLHELAQFLSGLEQGLAKNSCTVTLSLQRSLYFNHTVTVTIAEGVYSVFMNDKVTARYNAVTTINVLYEMPMTCDGQPPQFTTNWQIRGYVQYNDSKKIVKLEGVIIGANGLNGTKCRLEWQDGKYQLCFPALITQDQREKIKQVKATVSDQGYLSVEFKDWTFFNYVIRPLVLDPLRIRYNRIDQESSSSSYVDVQNKNLELMRLAWQSYTIKFVINHSSQILHIHFTDKLSVWSSKYHQQCDVGTYIGQNKKQPMWPSWITCTENQLVIIYQSLGGVVYAAAIEQLTLMAALRSYNPPDRTVTTIDPFVQYLQQQNIVFTNSDKQQLQRVI